MIKSLLSRFTNSRGNPSPDNAPVVDISRVIPGFQAPSQSDTPSDAPAVPSELVEAANDVPHLLTDTLSDEDRAEEAVASLSEKYDEWLQRDLSQLSDAWTKTRSDLSSMGELIRASHDLKGMAGTYGYPAIARIASSLNRLLESTEDASDLALINLHIEACRAAYIERRSNDGSDAIAQSVCAALETQVDRSVAK